MPCRGSAGKSTQKSFSSSGFNNEQDCGWTTVQEEEIAKGNLQRWCEVHARKQEGHGSLRGGCKPEKSKIV